MSESLTAEQRAELIMLGEKLGEVYDRKIRGFRELFSRYPEDSGIKEKYHTPEARHAAASQPVHEDALKQILEQAPEDITWRDLQEISSKDRAQAMEVWNNIKSVAKACIEGGQFAAYALDDSSGRAWERAQFSVLRATFIEAWKPADAIETCMVDMLAQAYFCSYEWLGRANSMAGREYGAVFEEKDTIFLPAQWKTPRLEVADAIDRAVAMADRFNRLFMRTLRQMRDLRRYSMPVTINNPEQVNIAAEGGQQVNVQQKGKAKKRTKRKLRPTK